MRVKRNAREQPDEAGERNGQREIMAGLPGLPHGSPVEERYLTCSVPFMMAE
jgi:hypothetical protein